MDTTAKEEVLLDENTDSKGHDFYMTHGVETSPDHKRIAYAVDTSGGEKYTLHVKELETGKELLRTPIKVAHASLLRFSVTPHSMPRTGSGASAATQRDHKSQVNIYHKQFARRHQSCTLSLPV